VSSTGLSNLGCQLEKHPVTTSWLRPCIHPIPYPHEPALVHANTHAGETSRRAVNVIDIEGQMFESGYSPVEKAISSDRI
jgi:hypothetical protein